MHGYNVVLSKERDILSERTFYIYRLELFDFEEQSRPSNGKIVAFCLLP